jgi:hypothetical protein
MRIGILGEFDGLGKPNSHELMASQLERYGIEVSRIRANRPLASHIQAIRCCDAVYGIAYGFSYRFFAMVRVLGKRSVNHWVGTDVWRTISNPAEARLARLTNFFVDKQLAVAPHLAVELASAGLQVEVVPIVPFLKMPGLRSAQAGQIRALAYLPDERPDFYGADIIYELAKEFAHLPFAVVTGTGSGQARLPNLEYLGYVPNIDEVYEQASILIRMTKHDGLPRMVLEGLARGYQVIYSHGFPYCHQASDLGEATSCLAQIIVDGCPVNYDGRRYVLEHYDQQLAIEQLVTALQR